jgi:threonine dehydrogenase-like Zn-dependent dehydrogenase
MRALCYFGVNDLRMADVPRPRIVNPRDVVLRVTATTACGSDLHLLHGYVPTMQEGDVIGHEFMGEVAEVGPDVHDLAEGDRVVVPSFIGCGSCSFCEEELWSACDNTNPNAKLQRPVLGTHTAGAYGYTHAFGGYAGSHAEYVRVPHGDVNCVPVPDELDAQQALFASDAWATGYMGADFCDIEPDDTIAVWGCGAVGLMAAHSATVMGADRVIAIDRYPERLALAQREAGAIPIDYSEVDVLDRLHDLTGGRGPDACIDAVGMEAHGTGAGYAYDRVKQALRLHTDRGAALRQAIKACRKGGTVSILGVYGVMDTFPIGAIVNKGLTVRTAQQHGQRYVPELLDLAAEGELDPSYLATHQFALEDAPTGYRLFEERSEGCVRPVFHP